MFRNDNNSVGSHVRAVSVNKAKSCRFGSKTGTWSWRENDISSWISSSTLLRFAVRALILS